MIKTHRKSELFAIDLHLNLSNYLSKKFVNTKENMKKIINK